MKKLELIQMENVNGGELRPLGKRDYGCGAYGLAAGIAAGCNPLVGGLTTLGCYLLT
ncbi:hypothetical protein [Flavobacterium sp. KACC 22761]|uniref:hypothetical protein n=1 Tax=Flavobacterium sp. KACC 22761 TaxID=3092665 RepID=UPI002A7572C9|nr:hypothetical protein [Flavobacterium sp. KACC 22761]WPO79716.1 hypothetical protein SCB73_04905 [Flavobacterium sp. KACC 22761]